MAARVSVRRGVTIRRIVAAQRRTARLASPQMQPASSDLDALFAHPPRCLFDARNRLYM